MFPRLLPTSDVLRILWRASVNGDGTEPLNHLLRPPRQPGELFRQRTALGTLQRLDAEGERLLSATREGRIRPTTAVAYLRHMVDRYRDEADYLTAREWYRAWEWADALVEAGGVVG